MKIDPSQLETNCNGIVATDIDTFLKMKIPPRTCLLAPWLPSSGLTQVYAYRGVGKTFFALNVAYAVATGGEFLGWKAPLAKRVLYIDGEMPAADMQARLQTIKGNDVMDSQNFKLITPDLQDVVTPNLANEESQIELHSYTSDADLIIVDNISTLCRTGKENDSDQWTPVQRWLLKMRSEGRSILLIHHANKSGGQRGTSGREDVLDTVIALRKPQGSSPTEGASFEVHYEKNRGFSGNDAQAFSASLSMMNGKQVWKTESLQASTYQRCVAEYKKELSCSEIAVLIGKNKSTVSRHLKKANDEGLIQYEH